MKIKSREYKGSKLKYQLALLLFSVFYWNLVIRLAIFLRVLGARNNNFREVLSKGLEFMKDDIILSTIVITLFATFSWFIMNFIYPRLIRKYQLRRLTFGIVIFDVAFFILLGILLGIVHYGVGDELPLIDSVSKLKGFIFNSTTLFFLIVLLIGSYVFQLIYTLIHQIGHGQLRKIMMGYYQKPQEENRIFMFLDLQSSTSFAEKLGHERYSDFIQDCFRFLSDPLMETMGNIYQFVGDEVVVTWNAEKTKNFKRAIDFFYLYEEELNAKNEYFEKKYDLFPVFSASLNSGKVMAAEVGEIKRELAFHGDVLNTAARIQKQCKRYRKKILVTRNFGTSLIKANTHYKLNYVDFVKFFGKNQKVKIYEVINPQE